MQIKRTSVVRDALVKNPATIAEAERDQVISVPVDVDHDMPDEEIEVATVRIAREGKVERLSLTFVFDGDDEGQVKGAADYVTALGQTLRNRADGLAADKERPEFSITPIAGGAVIGAVGGLSAGILLQELGRAGQSSGNPILSTVGIACAVGGAVVGMGIGGGWLEGEVSAFGATLKTRREG